MEVEEIDGIVIDRGPSGVSQAAETPPAGADVVQPPATPGDPPADPADSTPPGDGTGDPVTPPNDGTDPAGVYSAETVAAREAAAEERGRQAALGQLQEAARTQKEVTLKDQANESYRTNAAEQRRILAEHGITDPKDVQAIMGPNDTHNRFVVDSAFKIGLDLAGTEYADALAQKLGDKATEFFNANGGKPEPVADIIDRFANFRGPDLPWFKDGKPEDILALHKGLNAYVLSQIDERANAKIEEYKKANRPVTQPVTGQVDERTPTGPIGVAAYKHTLNSGGKMPDAKDIDAMTAAYVASIS